MWKLISMLFVQLAGVYTRSSASAYTWGEDEMPECLKKEMEE